MALVVSSPACCKLVPRKRLTPIAAARRQAPGRAGRRVRRDSKSASGASAIAETAKRDATKANGGSTPTASFCATKVTPQRQAVTRSRPSAARRLIPARSGFNADFHIADHCCALSGPRTQVSRVAGATRREASRARLWIPASAGMTDVLTPARSRPASRRNPSDAGTAPVCRARRFSARRRREPGRPRLSACRARR